MLCTYQIIATAKHISLHRREAKDYVLLFSLADDVRSKDATLEQVNTAIVHGVPGYILVSRQSKRHGSKLQ